MARARKEDRPAASELISSLAYLPSSPTLFNAGTLHSQLSSCYLLDSPKDELVSIYDRYTDIAKLSKYAGGIGLAYHRVRSRGSLMSARSSVRRGWVVPAPYRRMPPRTRARVGFGAWTCASPASTSSPTTPPSPRSDDRRRTAT